MTAPVAFITGVSRGIGAALASQFVERGFKVFGCATAIDSLPDGVEGFACDVGSSAEVQRMFETLGERCDRIDVLVNNAGLLGPRVPLEFVTPAEWRRVFEVNAHGPFYVTQSALPYLRKAAGKVVNVSSSVGRAGRATWGPYACSKHALEGLTDVLAQELAGDGIVVLSLNPGGTATQMRADAFPDEDPDSLPSAVDIANVIVEETLRATLEESGAKLNCRDFL